MMDRHELVALKPCPFCGGKPLCQAHRIAEDAEVAFVSCQQCGTQTEHYEDAYAPRDEAIAAWNKRAPSEREAMVDVAQDPLEPAAWMYHYPGDLEHGWQRFEFRRRIQSYEGMSCAEEDAGMVETPLYTADQLREAEKRGALAMREAAAQRFDVKEARMLSAIKRNPGHKLCEGAEAVAGFAKRTADTIRSLNPDRQED